MKAAHGTTNKIEKFTLFDYKINKNNDNTDSDHVSEGLDAYGPGIYFFNNLDDDGLIKNAKLYTHQEKESYIYKVKIDIEEENLLNNHEPDYFLEDDLVNMVLVYIDQERDKAGYNYCKFNDIIQDLEENFEHISSTAGDVSMDVINKKLLNEGIVFQLNEYSNPNEFESFHDWKDTIDEQYELEEPCSHINDEGGPEALVKYCVDSADSAWDVINNLFVGIAVFNYSDYSNSKNKTFQDLVLSELSGYSVQGAQVDDHILVVFDTDCIGIQEELSIKPKRTKKTKRTM
jgi:hypothetical protein